MNKFKSLHTSLVSKLSLVVLDKERHRKSLQEKVTYYIITRKGDLVYYYNKR